MGLVVFLAAGATGICYSRRSTAQPDSKHATLQLVAKARGALESQSYFETIRLARAVPDDHPSAAEVRLWEGIALWNLDRWEAAEEAWRRALQLNPEVPEAGWRLLLLFFYEQRFAEAEELALKLYPIEPDPGDRTRLLLELIRQDNERVGPEATVIKLEPVLLREPQNFHALRVLGLCYVQLGRIPEGGPLIEQALKMRTNDPEGWFTRVWYLYETGQMERLGQAWDDVPAEARQQAWFLRYRGMWAEAVDDSSEAERAYRQALELDPADRKAHYQLARLLRARGEEEDAAHHETEARELDEAREDLAARYQRTTQPNSRLSAEDCRLLGRLCSRLARNRQGEFWEQEAARRPTP